MGGFWIKPAVLAVVKLSGWLFGRVFPCGPQEVRLPAWCGGYGVAALLGAAAILVMEHGPGRIGSGANQVWVSVLIVPTIAVMGFCMLAVSINWRIQYSDVELRFRDLYRRDHAPLAWTAIVRVGYSNRGKIQFETSHGQTLGLPSGLDGGRALLLEALRREIPFDPQILDRLNPRSRPAGALYQSSDSEKPERAGASY